MQYNKMKFAVGAFVLVLIATIVASLFFLIKEKGTFEKRYSYHFNTDSASSFNVGMPLKLSGFNIGVIDNIELNDDGTVFMTFSVDSKNRKWVAQGSVLMIKKPLIGSPFIEFYSAIGNDVLDEGSTLSILMSDDINDMISKLEPVVNRIINIINSVDKITSNISKDDSALMMSLKNIEKFSANLAESDSLMTALTGDEKSTQNFINSLEQTLDILKEANNITSKLDNDIVAPASSAIKELNEIMLDVKNKLEVINGTVNAIGGYEKDLAGLGEQISAGIEKSNQIIDKVDSVIQGNHNKEVTLP